MRMTALARILMRSHCGLVLCAWAPLLLVTSCASSGPAEPRSLDTAAAGAAVPPAAGQGGSSSGAEVLRCPHVPSMCPMIYAPVHCSLELGQKVLAEIDAENACMGILRLQETWCPRLHKDSGGAEASPPGHGVESVRVHCSRTGDGEGPTPAR